MALKISANQSGVAHHIIDGMVTFPYAVDAHQAVQRHPHEWSFDPWPADVSAQARTEAGEPDVEMTEEERAAIAEHDKAVAEAKERLAKFHAKQDEKRKVEEQVAADEALVKSAPPQPAKRPFGRKGELTAAEKKMVKDKADADKMAASGATLTT